MYKHNGFYQSFHSKTRVEKIINVPYYSDFELNHGTSCLPLSSVGKGSLTWNKEPGLNFLSVVHILLYASHVYKIFSNFLLFLSFWEYVIMQNPQSAWNYKDSTPPLSNISIFLDIHRVLLLISCLIISAWQSVPFGETFLCRCLFTPH